MMIFRWKRPNPFHSRTDTAISIQPGMSVPRILYLVHRFPFPPNKGDRIRAFNIIRYLSTRAELVVVTLADEPVAEADAAQLSLHCDQLEVIPLARLGRYLGGLKSAVRGRSISEGMFASRRLAEVVGDLHHKQPFDRVLLSASSLVPYLNSPALRTLPAVVDLVDVDSEKFRGYAENSRGPKRWLYQFESNRLRSLETYLPENVEAVTLVSRPEADLYEQIRSQQTTSAAPTVHAIPNGVDLDYFAPQGVTPQEFATDLSCVFIGAMDYRPNIEGVEWFSQHVWPEIRQRLPKAEFNIVGRNPTPAVERLAQLPGINVVGSVPDVRPWQARAAAVVAPLKIARGMQNKVIEAMAMGKPVIATPEALTGFDIQHDKHALQADDANVFANCVCDCLTDASLRNRLGTAARDYAEHHHHWSSSLAGLSTLLHLPEVTATAPTKPDPTQLVSADS